MYRTTRYSDMNYSGYSSIPMVPTYYNPFRTQPFHVMQGMNGFGQMDSNPYMNSPFYNQYQFNGNPYYFQSMQNGQQVHYNPRPSSGGVSQTVFQNPLHPVEQPSTGIPKTSQGQPFMNPYPKASFLTKQPTGIKTVLNSFKSQDGSIDINKMVDTAGQMVNAVSQVSNVVKGFGGMFKA